MVRGDDARRGSRRPGATRPAAAGRQRARAWPPAAPPRTLLPDRRQLWFATTLAGGGAVACLLAALYLATHGVSPRPATVVDAGWHVVGDDAPRPAGAAWPAAAIRVEPTRWVATPSADRRVPAVTGTVPTVAAGFLPAAFPAPRRAVPLLLRGSSLELPTAALGAAPGIAAAVARLGKAGPAPLRMASLGGQPRLPGLPRTGPADEPPGEETRAVVVAPGDTLSALLDQLDIPADDSRALVKALTAVFDPQGLKPGDELDLTLRARTDGTTRTVGFSLSSGARTIEARRAGDGSFEIAAIPPAGGGGIVRHRVTGSIAGSLYGTARAEGVPDAMIVRMMHTHAYNVDFQRQIHAGDAFELFYSGGDAAEGGTLLFSSLTTGGTEHAYYRFVDADGATDYYDADGVSVKKPLMKTPINGAHITSGFGMRKHPLLGYSRMHEGVDFGAPSGSPVLAAGDGTIDVAGRNGGYGNYIRITHRPGLKTAYAHLSRFAKGMRPGKQIRQGQIIGYVGSTGTSTGPHLHYEVQVNGAKKNPLTVEVPDTGKRLAGAELTRFQKVRARIDAERAAAAPATVVASARP